MNYTVINFKTKKALKERLAEWHSCENVYGPGTGPIRCYNSGLGPDLSNYTGRVSLEGPHSWYCEGELVNGILVKVK